jgi:hypothetical protein
MDELSLEAAQEVEHAARHFASALQQCRADAQFAQASDDTLAGVALDLPLSPELWHWYRQFSPAVNVVVPQLGNWCTIYAVATLVEGQVGYRWLGTRDGSRGGRIVDWPTEWVVIGDIGADPIIAHTDLPHTPISSAMHGMGDWFPHEIAPTLATYLEAQARWIEVCLLQTGAAGIQDWGVALKHIWDDEAAYLPEVAEALRRSLVPILPAEHLHYWVL